MQIEIRELERKYEGLRIADPGRISRLTASLHQYGQQMPVLAVAGTAGGYVLIDGYARVSALESLAHDVVEALVLPLSEAEALIQSLRFEAARRRCALEDGWLLRELVEVQGRHQAQLAVALQRSASWISRRLALVRVLPEAVQAAIRQGQIPPQAAMRSLVPLSRGKTAHCQELVEHLEGLRISVRQMDALYQGYRQGDEEQRRRLVEHPWLYLKAKEETQRAEIIEPQGQAARLIRDLETLSALARRIRQQLHAGVYQRSTPRQRRSVDALLTEVGQLLTALIRLTEEKEVHHAGSGHARDHPAPAHAGPGPALDRPGTQRLEELRQASPA